MIALPTTTARLAGSFAGAFLAVAACARAQSTVTLPCDRDATLYESATGSIADGSGPGLFVGVTGQPMARRALVRFDLAQLPAGARVLGATVTTTSTNSASPTPLDSGWHRVLSDWAEGPTVAGGNGGGGGPAQSGDVTWLHRDYTSVLWNSPGGDYVATPSFSMPLQAVGSSTSTLDAGLVADVQSWVDNPAGNFGWLVRADETQVSTATRLSSRESGNGFQLQVTYLAPGAVGAWSAGCLVSQPSGTQLPMSLQLTGHASGGATIGLGYTSCPPSSVGATFFALGLEYGPAGLGVPLPGLACAVHLPLAGLVPGNVWLTSAQGAASDTFAVPANAPGFLITCQGAAVDATPFGASLSNAGAMLTQ